MRRIRAPAIRNEFMALNERHDVCLIHVVIVTAPTLFAGRNIAGRTA
jgi:hypothetical protein